MRTLIPFIMLCISCPVLGGCQDVTDSGDEVDIPDASYVWRICNEDTDYDMENIVIEKYFTNDLDSLVVGDVNPHKCSTYYPGPYEGESPINVMIYEQSGEVYKHVYLAFTEVTRGLPDSAGTPGQLVPGRYIYHFFRDTTMHYTKWVEIELEAYH